ncbi:MAG: hypothetical protein J7L55_01955 [Desulfurococcales archaeon]|nr:hypothetical protein [Desulfurococcales archaeon]
MRTKQIFKKPKAFLPIPYYQNLSLSGTYCELNCPYCRGKYLKGMTDVSDPERMRKILKHFISRGVRGFLLSGGFNKSGYLIIKKEHLRVVAEIRKNYEVVFSIHLGLAPKELVDDVWAAGIDFIDYEVPPSNTYLRVGKNLPAKEVRDYIELMDYMLRYGEDFVVPHLVVASTLSKSEEELAVMREVSEVADRIITVLIEIRGKGSKYDVTRVGNALRLADRLFNEVSLGCMRPPSLKKYDEEWISEGLLDRIAVPHKSLIKKLGLEVVYSCCGVPQKLFNLFPKS